MSRTRKPLGSVSIVGAGPGDPGLLTLRGVEVLGQADVVVVDSDVEAAVTPHEAPDVEVLRVGDEGVPLEDVGKLLAARAKDGSRVVRVVASDPFTSPSAVAEAQAVARTKSRLEIVPGVPTVVGVTDYAGVPVGLPRTVAAVTGHPDWRALAGAPGALVLQAQVADIGKAAAALIEHGKAGDTLVSVTVDGTTTRQRTVVSSLDRVETDAAAAGLGGDVVVVVGDVVKARDRLSWYETKPLFGWRVLVPRTREQAGALSLQLRSLGATPVEVPTIAVEPPRTPAPMDRAIKGLVAGRYAWIAFTSVNAVRAIREKLEEVGLDARAFAGIRIAAIGEQTAAALMAFGIRPDLVPSGEQSSEGLLADWAPYDDVLDPLDRVFLPRADIATETLVAGLKDRGWAVDDVTAYRTVRAAPPPAATREALKGGGFDAVLFTSSSTVRNLVGIAGKPHESTVLAAIGPQTAATAAELGLRVDVQAETPSVSALVEALAGFAVERRAAQEEAAKAATVTELKRPSRARKTAAAKA